MATEIGRLSAPIGTIKIPVEIDVFAIVDGERMRIGTAESELSMSVKPGTTGGGFRGGGAGTRATVVEFDGCGDSDEQLAVIQNRFNRGTA